MSGDGQHTMSQARLGLVLEAGGKTEVRTFVDRRPPGERSTNSSDEAGRLAIDITRF